MMLLPRRPSRTCRYSHAADAAPPLQHMPLLPCCCCRAAPPAHVATAMLLLPLLPSLCEECRTHLCLPPLFKHTAQLAPQGEGQGGGHGVANLCC